MAVAEMRFEGKNPERLREILSEQVAKADQWNHYSKADVEKYLGEVNEHLATATEQEMSAALLTLAQKGKVIKYVPITQQSALNAERCYVLSNADVTGILVNPKDATAPSLRNVDATRTKDAQELYTQTVSVTDSTANWLIVGDDRPGIQTQYVIYNLQTGLCLQPANGTVATTMSETPVKVRIALNGTGFTLSGTTGKRSHLVANPSAPQGQELTGIGNKGATWHIYENLALQPQVTLVKALRDYLKTGKFVAPTGIESLHSAAGADARSNASSDMMFDLSGRRITAPAAGQVVISKQGKSLQTH